MLFSLLLTLRLVPLYLFILLPIIHDLLLLLFELKLLLSLFVSTFLLLFLILVNIGYLLHFERVISLEILQRYS